MKQTLSAMVKQFDAKCDALSKPVMFFIVAAVITAMGLVVLKVFHMANADVEHNRIDSFIDDGATRVCIAIDKIKPEAQDAIARAANALLNDPELDNGIGGDFKYIDAGNGRFRLALRDRNTFITNAPGEGFVRDAELRLAQRVISRSTTFSASEETCYDFLTRADERMFRGEIKRDPRIETKRPPWISQ